MDGEGSAQKGTSELGGETFSQDSLFGVLSDRHRRHVLYYLREHDDVDVAELVDVVTGWLTAEGESERMATAADRNSVSTALHHVHLPKLQDIGLIVRDASGNVEVRELPDSLDRYLDLALENEPHLDASQVPSSAGD